MPTCANASSFEISRPQIGQRTRAAAATKVRRCTLAEPDRHHLKGPKIKLQRRARAARPSAGSGSAAFTAAADAGAVRGRLAGLLVGMLCRVRWRRAEQAVRHSSYTVH